MSSPLPLEELQSSFHGAGFDVFKPFPTHVYNASRPASCPELSTYGRVHAMSVILGNSGHLWPIFLSSLMNSRPGDPLPSDPLDRYTEETVSRILRDHQALRLPQACSVSFVHTHPGRHGFVDAIHASVISGLAFNSPVALLALHPALGPWFALRAVLSFDVDLEFPAPMRLSDPVPETELARLWDLKERLNPADFGRDWRSWLAFRDAVSEALGTQSHRYPEDMIAYHYTGDISILLGNRCSISCEYIVRT